MTRFAVLACCLGLSSAASAFDEPGTYVMIVDVASQSRIPYAGTTEVVSRSLVRIDLAREGAEWVATQQVCDVKLLSDTRAETVMPLAFVDALPAQRYTVHLANKEGTVAYTADPGPTIVGFDPKMTGGAVPTKASDPGVVDMDGDGKPGGTVHLVIPVFGAVKIYVAQRGHSRYVGTLANGVVTGRVDIVSLDQRTLGASFAPFAANPEITPVPESSRFRIERSEPAMTCAALRQRWSGGFAVP